MGSYKLTVGDVDGITTKTDGKKYTFGEKDFNVSIETLTYKKKIFAPCEINAVLCLTAVDTGSDIPTLSQLQDTFSRKKVTLIDTTPNPEVTLAENYFVYKMKPCRSRNSEGTVILKVELSIFSMDKLITIDKYCNVFTAKRLGEDIFKGELNKFWLDSKNQLKGEVNMQMLAFKNQDTDKMSEVRQPYLVQYNESFYDFLARTAIRCGEMLYFEGGSLHLGMKPALKASTDQTSVTDTIDYEESVDHVLDVQGRHYDFTKRSSENDNRYCDSPAELAGELKKTENPPKEGTVEGGSVTEKTIKTYEKGVLTTTVQTTYYCSETDKDVFLLKGEPSQVVTTTVITDNNNKDLWNLTETVKYEYEKEIDDNGNVTKDSDGNTQYKKNEDGSFVSTSKTTKVLTTGLEFKAVYNQPEANDANFKELLKDGYTNFLNESFDYRLMLLNLLYSVLNNTNIVDMFSDLVWSVAKTAKDASVSMKKKNDMNNDKNLTLDKDKNPEQTTGTIFNLFSTLKSLIDDSNLPVNQKGNVVSLLMADFYSKIRRASQTVSQMLVRLNYGANDQGLCLGDVIKVEGGFYVVIKVELDENGNYIVEAIPPFNKKVSTDNTTITEAIPCPPLMPEIPTVRTAEAQVAFVEDNLDPNRFGRVRVRYPWQPGNGDKSPWIRMATPFATAGGGVTFRPCTGDEVLLNYEDGNIERPYIVGSLQSRYVTDPWLPLPDRVIRSKNGHSITFNDSTDGANFLWGLLPGASLIKSCVPIYKPLITDQNMVDLTGGINISDRYGLYQINMSSDKRTVNINSPLGNVSLNAFTGISISAPNGNIKIAGKNVSIAASNKLTLTSGSGISDRWFPLTKDGWEDLGKGLITDVADRTVGKLIDFSFLRTILEVFTRPVDGTLKIKSNTYVLIEAGKGAAQVPYDDYKHPTIEFIKSPIKNFVDQGILLGKLKKTIDLYTSKVDTLSKDIVEAYKNADQLAKTYQNTRGFGVVLYQKLNNKMQLSDIVDKVYNNKDNTPFKVDDVIKEDDFEFDTNEYFRYQLTENETKPTQEDGGGGDDATKLAEYNRKKRHDAHCSLYRGKLVVQAQAFGINIKLLFDAVKAWTEFDFSKQEKKECYTSEYLRDFFRKLDFENDFISNVKDGTISWGQKIDIEKQLIIWKRKFVYELIKEVKDENYYQEMFGVGSDSKPNDFSSEEDWKKFADTIGKPTFTPGTALSVDRKIRGVLKSYLWDGKASQWLDSFTCHHRWKAAENGKILISDKAGETICFEKGLPAINHSYGTGNSAYYLELRKKVNGVK